MGLRLLKQSVPVRSGPSGWARAWWWLVRRRWWSAGVGVLVVAALVWGLWPASARRYVPDPRARQFSSFSVCVLTGSGGIGGGEAAAVWAGVQDAAKATSVRGSYLTVPPPDTEASATLYVNTLASRNCSLVVATGPSEVLATGARAAVFGSQRFVVVGSGSFPGNVTVVPSGSAQAVRSSVASVIERAVPGR